MSETRVVIIEDEFFASMHLKDLVVSLGYEVDGIFHSGEDFLQNTNWEFDVAIVDILLSEELSGIDVAQTMKVQMKPFIFLTANQDATTLKAAARLAPAAYISKPFKPNDVAAALEIIKHQLPSNLQVRTQNGIEEINPNSILFIKSDGVYVELHTQKGMLVQRKLLKEIEEELPDTFVRVHRSYLVNKLYVQSKTSSHVVVHGEQIPVSRSFRDQSLLL